MNKEYEDYIQYLTKMSQCHELQAIAAGILQSHGQALELQCLIDQLKEALAEVNLTCTVALTASLKDENETQEENAAQAT